jgi:hypothetical protein
MPANEELRRLAVRKAELIAESDRRRQELQACLAELEPAVTSVERGMGFVRQIKILWAAAAPLLAMRATGKGKAGLWHKILKGWVLWRSIAAARK